MHESAHRAAGPGSDASVRDLLDAAARRFREHFARTPEASGVAPGRVNLIGEHTDYNDGLVLPIAIERRTCVAVASRDDQTIRVRSEPLDAEAGWTLGDWQADAQPRWTAYVAGVAEGLRQRGARLSGFDALISGDLPVGGGLSSSAALTVATAKALTTLCGEPLRSEELIDLCRAAEHDAAGVPCGLMDPTVVLLAREAHALLLDCRSREVRYVPFDPPGHTLLVIDSGIRHELASSAYAERQRQCAAAVEYFRRLNPEMRALRDVTPQMVRAHATQMDPVLAARAHHVVSENQRVLEAAEALRAGDWAAFGRLLDASHRSQRDDYETSCREIDRIVAFVRRLDGVLGARMTGGGFGGCVIALAEAARAETIATAVRQGLHNPTGRPLRVFATRAAGGATHWTP